MLDSQFFPHILDAVIAFAPPESLITLRGCSRDVRKAADKRLFEHVELATPRDQDGDVVAVSPFGSNLRYEWLSLSGEYEPPQDPARTAMRNYVAKRMGSTLVIDLPRAVCQSLNDSWWTTLENFLGRIAPRKYPPYHRFHPKIRVFGEPHSYPTTWPGNWTTSPECIVFDDAVLSHVPKRLVHTIFFRPGDVATGDGILVGLTRVNVNRDNAEELVFHLLLPNKSVSDPEPKICVGVVEELVDLPFWYGQSLMVTVVGGAQKCRTALGLHRTASDDSFHAALGDVATDYECVCAQDWAESLDDPDDDLPNEIRAHLRKHLRFISPRDYAAEVGAAQIALETQRDPYGPPAENLP